MKAIILAGGSGSRLWPLSREMYPKQLLSLSDKESLLQKTFLRLLETTPAADIVSITNIKHSQDIRLQLNQINAGSTVLSEPLGKNTAPCIACALEYFKKRDEKDDYVIILPSDHLINNNEAFNKTIKAAEPLMEKGFIVTFGIKPEYPETGYGYIKVKKPTLTGFEVDSFVEKPEFEIAKKYVQDGGYYWNAGIFAGKISILLDEIKNYAPDIYENAAKVDFKNSTTIPYGIYESMPSVSIDYAVMEKSTKIALVELQSDWNDLGSWQSLYNTKEKDEKGNVLEGNIVVNDVKNSFIYSQKELVAASDLEDIILVETEDAIMACKMSNSQNVKKLYEKLKKAKSDTIKLHKTVFRPWGYYTCLNSGAGYLTKTICVMPHQKLSVQSHSHRSEHWVVLEGQALVLLNDRKYFVYEGDSIDIPLGAKHSLQNPNDEELKILEVQKGEYISEEDIIRYEDKYGRV